MITHRLTLFQIQSVKTGTDLKLVCNLKFESIKVTDNGGEVAYEPDATLTVTG